MMMQNVVTGNDGYRGWLHEDAVKTKGRARMVSLHAAMPSHHPRALVVAERPLPRVLPRRVVVRLNAPRTSR